MLPWNVFILNSDIRVDSRTKSNCWRKFAWFTLSLNTNILSANLELFILFELSLYLTITTFDKFNFKKILTQKRLILYSFLCLICQSLQKIGLSKFLKKIININGSYIKLFLRIYFSTNRSSRRGTHKVFKEVYIMRYKLEKGCPKNIDMYSILRLKFIDPKWICQLIGSKDFNSHIFVFQFCFILLCLLYKCFKFIIDLFP